MQISSNGTRVLYALGLGEAIERVGVVVAGKEIRLWSTGQTWKLFDLGAVSVERYGFPYMMFHRGDLHAVLLDGDPARAAGRDPSQPQVHGRDAERRRRRDRLRERRAGAAPRW